MDDQRAVERSKYVEIYGRMPNYRMGEKRMQDAIADLTWARDEHNCVSYLDIGCGRGEMLAHADALGFHGIGGTEIVEELCEHEAVTRLMVHELGFVQRNRYDFVSSFDVIEHLIPGDDVKLLQNMARIAKYAVAVTANNKPSVDPANGNDLHINKRPYDEWDEIIRAAWEPGFYVERCTGKTYVSETWRGWRRAPLTA